VPIADSCICNVCGRENPIGGRLCLKCGTALTDETSRLKEFVDEKSSDQRQEELIAGYIGLGVLAVKGLELLAAGALVLAMLIWLIDASLFWDFGRLHPGLKRFLIGCALYLVAAQAARGFWLKQTTASGRELGE